MKRVTAFAVLLVVLAAPAWVGWDEGWAAYERGDYATALREFRPLAEQGKAWAQFNLGTMYDNGQGVPQDYAEAVKWYRKAAEQGYADAQNNLGVMYDKGEGVTQDYAEAVKWYRKAAEQGKARAQYNLGVMYENGYGVPQDYAEAVKWYRKAAEQGKARAQYNLGVMYENGEGVTQDYAEAVRWYRSAAEQGDADAQYNLGVMEARDSAAKNRDNDLFSGVLEKALVGAAVGAISVIVFGPIIWLEQRRKKRKAEKKASRERVAQRAFSKVQREDDEKWAREFASRPAPDIGRKPD